MEVTMKKKETTMAEPTTSIEKITSYISFVLRTGTSFEL